MLEPDSPGFTDQAARPGPAWIRAYAGGARSVAPPAMVAPGGRAGRAADDARAAWAKWHVRQAIADGLQAESAWHDLLERVRVETLASRDLPGVCSNLRLRPELQPPDAYLAAVYRWARLLASSESVGEAIAGPASGPARSAAASPGLAGFLRRLIGADIAPADTLSASALDQFADTMTAALDAAEDVPRYWQILRPLVDWLCQRLPEVSTGSVIPVPAAGADDTSEALAREVLEEKSTAIESAPSNGLGYRVFSRSLDEENSARAWFRPSDADLLEGIFGEHRQKSRQLAHRLMRRLQAASNRSWDFELEEGLLDNRRLASLAVPAPVPRVFRTERKPELLDTQVCLLVDQSGSMRGKRQVLAAQAIDLAVHVLELCGVTCEVLGYTTRYAADNPLVEAWRRLGSPEQPGRLNATRHIVYKHARQPWKRCRSLLGLMLRKDFGRENIDGEALTWAARRLLASRSRRSVMIVLSDGSPFDEATSAANNDVYLENHLRKVIADLERSGISLFAIGTGLGVGRFYRHSETVRDPAQISEALFARLSEVMLK